MGEFGEGKEGPIFRRRKRAQHPLYLRGLEDHRQGGIRARHRDEGHLLRLPQGLSIEKGQGRLVAAQPRRPDGLAPEMPHPDPEIIRRGLVHLLPRNASNPRIEDRYCWIVHGVLPAICRSPSRWDKGRLISRRHSSLRQGRAGQGRAGSKKRQKIGRTSIPVKPDLTDFRRKGHRHSVVDVCQQ